MHRRHLLATPALLLPALARAEGAAGVVLFSHESLDLAALRRLREQAFGQRAGLAGPTLRSGRQ